MSEKKKSLLKASVKQRIIKISNELRLKKEGKNNFKEYSYFRPDDINVALNPLFKEYNLIAIFNMRYNHEIDMYACELVISDVDNDEDKVVYHFDIPLTQVSGASNAQNAGATMTYAKRYMLMNAFNLADNSIDPDNERNQPIEAGSSNEKLTPNQSAYIKRTFTKLNIKDEAERANRCSVMINRKIDDISDLTKKEASQIIGKLKKEEEDKARFLSSVEDEGKQLNYFNK